MFYIYHIKGKKWGCTNRLEQRLKQQGYKISDVDRLIIVGNEDKAADMELELNKEYGYIHQLTDYRLNTKSKCSKAGKIGGLTQGNINKLSGHIYNLGKNGNKKLKAKGGVTQSQITNTCPHCNTSGKSNAMYRWHMDNCKLKL